MTRRVANAEKYRLVFALRLFEGLGSPWIPVNRIIGVLEEVGAGFLGEAV
jgi:hypothetical protein